MFHRACVRLVMAFVVGATTTCLVSGCCTRRVDFALGADMLGRLEGKIGLELRNEAECKAYSIMADAMDTFAADVGACKQSTDQAACIQAANDRYSTIAQQMLVTLEKLQQGTKGEATLESEALRRLTELRDQYASALE